MTLDPKTTGRRPSFPFDDNPPHELDDFSGPTELIRRGLQLPMGPGVYLVACGHCLAHVGTSSKLRSRVRTLAALGTHRGSSEVICAAYCTKSPPLVWWQPTSSAAEARSLEAALKRHYGEPPVSRTRYESCVNGGRLRADLIDAAGRESWEAGYVEAVFAIGEKLNLLFQPRFQRVWSQVARPPGPWEDSFPE